MHEYLCIRMHKQSFGTLFFCLYLIYHSGIPSFIVSFFENTQLAAIISLHLCLCADEQNCHWGAELLMGWFGKYNTIILG